MEHVGPAEQLEGMLRLVMMTGCAAHNSSVIHIRVNVQVHEHKLYSPTNICKYGDLAMHEW